MEEQKLLKKLTNDKDIPRIREVHGNINLTSKEKGDLFEWYLGYLFTGNGWYVVNTGQPHDGEIYLLVYETNNTNYPSLKKIIRIIIHMQIIY